MTYSAPLRVAVVYHSGSGHTARQAEAVARGAASVANVEVDVVSVEPLAEELWATLDRADAIVFGSPTYMGSASAPFTAFMDATAEPWAGRRWHGKVAAGFTNSGCQHGDKMLTLIQFVTLAAQHGMIWVGLDLPPGHDTSKGSPEDLNRLGAWLGAMAQSNKDEGPELAPPASDLRTAEHLGRRVAEVALQFRRGASTGGAESGAVGAGVGAAVAGTAGRAE